ncbi:NAD(P)H-binding protein [Albimonas pacifica]|uniref:Uncharacterized conserved protein YbjT, contains NAD(P)-binding and DUF2867 domains n=1 Tax=Albimonas pacifica TaxID=1114924 RepID=A0A1I3GCN5_9RHOB|nr:NAD(P)H-binding protein [Albimonas pacifica]SFI21167.1 Uncharacterized conserved protein YbjT, contains NAD(P)-binding and DUF2867 domains [Albimonas pacifica]
MPGKILVLGAGGAVGRPLVRALVARGERVRAATRDGRAVEGAEGVAFDHADPATFAPAFEGVDRLHLMLPGGYVAVTQMLLPVVDFAAARGVKTVMQSVFGVDADDTIPYRQVELALERSGAPFVILRPNWFADNFLNYWGHGVLAGEIAVPAGEGASSFIDVRDVAESAAAALTTDRFDGRAFNLTGPAALTYAEAAAILAGALGRPVAYRDIPEAPFVEGLIAAGLPADYAPFLASIFAPVRAGWTAAVAPDVETLTGRAPRSLETWARDAAPAFRTLAAA